MAVAHEGERVLKCIAATDRVVLLDERGRDASSEDIARLLGQVGAPVRAVLPMISSEFPGDGQCAACRRRCLQASDNSWPGVVFCIGGPFGHSPAVRARGDDVVRLSRCVLNHTVARVVLLEQLYRAWTILRGEPYHH